MNIYEEESTLEGHVACESNHNLPKVKMQDDMLCAKMIPTGQKECIYNMNTSVTGMNRMMSQNYVASSSYGVGSCDAASSGYGTTRSGNITSPYKEKNKEIVKECLKQLKLLTPSINKESREGRIPVLKQLAKRMKEIKEENNMTKTEFGSHDHEVIGIDFLPITSKADDSANFFYIAVSLEGNIVLQVCEELTDMLGYPKHYWHEQAFTDFVKRKDIVTVHNSLAEVTTRDLNISNGQELTEASFFFALRHYKCLREGFNILRSEKFTAFRAQGHVACIPCAQGGTVERKVVLLECTPVYSLFIERGILPAKKTFVTKQTVFCNYQSVQFEAISLLGYLPQDMIGTSIFMYYHPNDLPMLYNIYSEIISNPGVKLTSAPYRMRCRNGDYIHVITEWSSCVNTFTNKWDFIVGRHEVCSAPDNLDVFAEPPPQSSPIEGSEVTETLEKSIKSLFLQVGGGNKAVSTIANLKHKLRNVDDDFADSIAHSSDELCGGNRDLPRNKRVNRVNLLPLLQLQYYLSPNTDNNQPEFNASWLADQPDAIRRSTKGEKNRDTSSSKPPPMFSRAPLEIEVKPSACGKPSEESIHPALNSLLSLCHNELHVSLIYEGVNYASHIRRFLLSCPSMRSIQHRKNIEYQSPEIFINDIDDVSEASCSEEQNISMDMDFQLSRPPSHPSSTKVLVSEHELMPHSPSANEDTGDEMQRESSSEENYTPVRLTRNVLEKHNKIQVDQFLEGVLQEKMTELPFLSNIFRKRTYLPFINVMSEESEDIMANNQKLNNETPIQPSNSQFREPSFLPPFPITSIVTPKTSTKPIYRSSVIGGHGLEDKPLLQSKFVTINNLCSVSATCDRLPPQKPTHQESPNPCPQTGLTVDQQLEAHNNYSLSGTSLHYDPFGGPPHHNNQESRAPDARHPQISGLTSLYPDNNTTDSASSVIFPLESCNTCELQSTQSEESPMLAPTANSTLIIPTMNKPYWQRDVILNKDIVHAYVAPVLNEKEVLQKDNSILRNLKQSNRIVTQLKELLQMQSACESDADCDEMKSEFPKPKSTAQTVEDPKRFGKDAIADSKKNIPSQTSEKPMGGGYSEGSECSERPDGKIVSVSPEKGRSESGTAESPCDNGNLAKILHLATANRRRGDFKKKPCSFESEGTGSAEYPEVGSCDQNKSEQGIEKTSENEVDNTSETGSSKGSSDFTQSDQRSHEEMGSSLKESDNGSSDSGSLNIGKTGGNAKALSTNPEAKNEKKPLGDALFEQLFLPVKKKECKTNLKSAPWLEGVTFGSKVQMSYEHRVFDREHTLGEDKGKLLHMPISDLLYTQMGACGVDSVDEDMEPCQGEEVDCGSQDMEHRADGEMRGNVEDDSLSSEPSAKRRKFSLRQLSKDVGTRKHTLNELCGDKKTSAPPGVEGLTDSSHAGYERMGRADAAFSYDSQSATSSSVYGHKKVCFSSSNPGTQSSSSNKEQGTGSSGSHRGSSENNSDSAGEPKSCANKPRITSTVDATATVPLSQQMHVHVNYGKESLVAFQPVQPNVSSHAPLSGAQSATIIRNQSSETYRPGMDTPCNKLAPCSERLIPSQSNENIHNTGHFFLPDLLGNEEIDLYHMLAS